MSTNIFEKASRMALRFESPRGLLTLEDLWTLPLQSKNGLSLDALAMAQHRLVKDSEELSFVKPSVTNNAAELKLEILKHIIEVRMAENSAKTEAAEKRARKEKILELLAAKKDEALAQKSEEELLKELESL